VHFPKRSAATSNGDHRERVCTIRLETPHPQPGRNGILARVGDLTRADLELLAVASAGRLHHEATVRLCKLWGIDKGE
jgi:hypothetical protein